MNQKANRERSTRTEIAKALSHMMGMSLSKADRAVQIVFQQVLLCVIEGKIVDIPGFGRIYAVLINERPGSNPRTQEPIIVPASVRIRLEGSSQVKRQLNSQVEKFRQLKLEGIAATTNEDISDPESESCSDEATPTDPSELDIKLETICN